MSNVIDLLELARAVREQGRVSSRAGDKNMANALYRQADRVERATFGRADRPELRVVPAYLAPEGVA